MVPMIAISPGPALMATALLELGEVLLALKAVVEGLLLVAGDGRTVGTDEVGPGRIDKLPLLVVTPLGSLISNSLD